jgi:methylmalonyl-CoA epimerase
MPEIKKIDHVAIVVKDLDSAVDVFSQTLGMKVQRIGEVPALHLRRAFLEAGDAFVELFQPTSDDNPAARFLAERGEGIYLLSFEVDDLDAATRELAAKGVRVHVQQVPGGPRLGFLSPKATHGAMIQLIENPKFDP